MNINPNKIFIEKARKVHGDRFDYTLVEYVQAKINIKIICKIHGAFDQTPNTHLRGKGCRKCADERTSKRCKMKLSEFIEKSNIIHNNKYDYSLVNYENSNTRVNIVCPKHGVFEQFPKHHLNGHGCINCKSFKKEEQLFNKIKDEFNVVQQYKPIFLKTKNRGDNQSLDFYLPQYKIAIEYQGVQHFSPVEVFGGEKGLIETIKRDVIKKQKCDDNGVELLYFTFNKKDIPIGGYSLGYVYSDFDELINYIKTK